VQVALFVVSVPKGPYLASIGEVINSNPLLPSVKSSIVQAALFVLCQLCVESIFCNLLFLTILFACAGYVQQQRSIVHQEDFHCRAAADDTKEANIEAAVHAGFHCDCAVFSHD
jgi:hypothetical protein